MRIAFLVGDVITISGGSNVIIEYAVALERLGHEVHLLTRDRCDISATAWHPRLKTLRFRHVTEAGDEPFDFAFATWWLTYFELFRVRSRVYAYFTQSLEARFHPEVHYKLANRCTYALPLLVITEARWLEQFIRMVQPAARTLHLPNGLSRVHFPRLATPPERSGPLRVLVEGPWHVSFKGVPETFEVLREARARGVPFETGWLTIDSKGARPVIGGVPVVVHEKLPIHKVHEVLRRYDVLLKMSHVEGMYGPPLEMFSQGGTAITTTVTGSDEYMIHGHNGLLVEPYNRRQVIRYLDLLDRRRDYLASLRKNALATAHQYPDWEERGAELERALQGILSEGFSNADARASLAALSTLEQRWLDEVWRNERVGAVAAVKVHAGFRRVKESRPYQFGKLLLPPTFRARVRAYVTRVLR